MLLKRKSATLAPKKAFVVQRKFTMWRPICLTRHLSHRPLRTQLPLLPFKAVIRLGSTTPSVRKYELNSIQGVRNSSSKLLMKQYFTKAGVKTADWWTCMRGNFDQLVFLRNDLNEGVNINQLPYPIISKSLFGSRGIGNTKHDTQEHLENWMRGKNLSGYIFEKYIGNMSREYRIHISGNSSFYACRKLLRNDAPIDSWQKHADICTFVVEENPSFKKPNNWDLIIEDCVKAKNALGLDICAFDLMIQGSIEGVERNNPEWIIVESCSAPSLMAIGIQKYIEEIPKLLKRKYLNG